MLIINQPNIMSEAEKLRLDAERTRKEEEMKSWMDNLQSEERTRSHQMRDFWLNLHTVAPSLSLNFLSSPLLKYKYPPASPSIVHNICTALLANPRFYCQVLHLMNKMNLPPPFEEGPSRPPPDPVPDIPERLQTNSHLAPESESESEIETDFDPMDMRRASSGRPTMRRKRKLETGFVGSKRFKAGVGGKDRGSQPNRESLRNETVFEPTPNDSVKRNIVIIAPTSLKHDDR